MVEGDEMKCPRDGAEMELRPQAKSLWRQYPPRSIEVYFCSICRVFRCFRIGDHVKMSNNDELMRTITVGEKEG